MSTRDRILARRSQFVVAALALSGCHEQPKPETPARTVAASSASSAPRPPPDRDGDGIPDERDHCTDIPGPSHANGCPPQPCLSIIPDYEIRILEQIYFAKDSAKVQSVSLQVLDAIVAALAAHPDLTVEIRGHADKGEKAKLGAERARAVRDYLVGKGIDAARLEMADLAMTAPAEPGPHEKNRRVDFVVPKK